MEQRQGHHHEWIYSDIDEVTRERVRKCMKVGCEVRDWVDEKGVIIESYDRRSRSGLSVND